MVASEFFSWFDAAVAAARPRALMQAAGYASQHQGGNCLAWSKDMGDGSLLLVCTVDNDIDGDPDAVEWIVGRHDLECGFVELSDAFTLTDALVAAAQLPSPAAVGGTGSQQSFDSVEQAIAASREKVLS